MNSLDKYPRIKRLLDETGMTYEQAYTWAEVEYEKLRKSRV